MKTASQITAGLAAIAMLASALPAFAEGPIQELKVTIKGLGPQGRFADQQSFCIPAATGHTAMGSDISPRCSGQRGPMAPAVLP